MVKDASRLGLKERTPLLRTVIYPPTILGCPLLAYPLNFAVSMLLSGLVGAITGAGFQAELFPFVFVLQHLYWWWRSSRDPFIWRVLWERYVGGRPWPAARASQHDANTKDTCRLSL